MEHPSKGRTGNKVRTYLPYAIGEILLVVIGILIALQVNNWNEERRALDEEQQMLNTLHDELEANLEELKFDISRMDTLIISNRKLLGLFGEKNLPGEESVDSLILASFKHITWNPSSYMLNNLKNSGQISRISDPDIQSLLFKWERHFENLEEYREDDKTTSEVFLSYLREFGSLRNIDYTGQFLFDIDIERSKLGFSNLSLLNELRFENIVDDKLFVALGLRRQYQISVGIIEELLDATGT